MRRIYFISTVSIVLVFTGFFIIIRKLDFYYKEYKYTKTFPVSYFTEPNIVKRNNKYLVIIIGDSRIAQWKNLPAVSDCQIINMGISGETISQLVLRIEHDVIENSPDIVIIQAGINDLTSIGVFPEKKEVIINNCKTNMDFIINLLVKHDINVVVLTVMPFGKVPLFREIYWSDEISSVRKKLNNHIEGFDLKSITIVDSDNLFLDGTGINEDLYSDFLHLNESGYSLLNKKISPIIKQIINSLRKSAI